MPNIKKCYIKINGYNYDFKSSHSCNRFIRQNILWTWPVFHVISIRRTTALLQSIAFKYFYRKWVLGQKKYLTRVAGKERKSFRCSPLHAIPHLNIIKHSRDIPIRFRTDRQSWGGPQDWWSETLDCLLALASRHCVSMLSDVPLLCLSVHICTIEA